MGRLKKLDDAMKQGTWLMFFMKRSGGNDMGHERQKLIEHYLPFAREIARRWTKAIPHEGLCGYDDLLQQALIAMNSCLDKWEPACGFQFTSYAGVRMNGACMDYLRTLDWCDRGTRKKVKEVIRLRGQGLDHNAVAAEVGISPHESAILEKDTVGFLGDYFQSKYRVVDGEVVVDDDNEEIEESPEIRLLPHSSVSLCSVARVTFRTSRPNKLRDRLRALKPAPSQSATNPQSALATSAK